MYIKYIFFIWVILSGIFQACQHKGIPTIASRTTEPAKPVPETISVKPDPAKGKIIFSNRCSRCHALPDPVQFTAKRWEGILSVMIPRARLGREQEIHLTAFINENGIK